MVSIKKDQKIKKYSEDCLQIFIISFLKKLDFIYPNELLFFSVPNGGTRNKAEAVKLKMTGLLKGVYDLTIMGKQKICYVEVKTSKGILSASQKEFKEKLDCLGFNSCVLKAKTPQEILLQLSELMESFFGLDQKGISSARASVLSNPSLSRLL